MRIALSLTVLLLGTTATAHAERPSLTNVRAPATAGEVPQDLARPCRNRVVLAYGDQALSRSDRKTAGPGTLFIYSVDKRRDGCPVLMKQGSREDVRPLPRPTDPRMMPAR
jgi:hypothetical protein